MKTIFKTQLKVAEALAEKIDLFWNDEVEEPEINAYIQLVIKKNHDLIFNGDGYTKAVLKRLGKQRVRLIDKLINEGIK